MKILAVDDASVVLLSIKRILQRQGHDVVTSADGDEALSVLQRDPSIELVLTDLRMPRMDGVELCRRARNLPRRDERPVAAPPFILLSASSTGWGDPAALKENEDIATLFEAVLEKPFSKARLLAAVEAVEERLTPLAVTRPLSAKS